MEQDVKELIWDAAHLIDKLHGMGDGDTVSVAHIWFDRLHQLKLCSPDCLCKKEIE